MIDVDSTREQPIMFSKSDSDKEPETKEEAFEMVITDIKCLTFGLATLINLAHVNGFGTKDELLEECVKALTTTLNQVVPEEETTDNEEVKSEE